MGWFNDQIRDRMMSDQNLLEDSFLRMAGVVLDKWNSERLSDEITIAKEALDQILKYYHEKPPEEIPKEIGGIEQQMEFALRPSGLMVRDVNLEDGWQNNAFGPMLGYMKEKGTAVALLPGRMIGYWFIDPSTGRKTRVTRKTARLFSAEALCFYRPLPLKKLGIPDLIHYMWKCMTTGDLLQIVLATLLVTLATMIEPKVYNLIMGPVLKSRSIGLLNGMAVFLLSAALTTQILSMIKNLLTQRINTKTALSIGAAVMMRILALPVSFFRKFSSGELANRANSVNSLCSILLNNILSLGLSSVASLMFFTQIFSFTPALAVPSFLIILATVTVSILTALRQIGISRRKMQLEAKEDGMSYALLTGIQKIKLSGSEKRAFARWGRLYAQSAELEYNPPPFLKYNSVITMAIPLIGTVILYFLALKSGVSQNDYYSFSAAFGKVSGAFTALAGIAISLATIPPVLEMAEPILKAEPEVAAEKESVTGVSGSIELSHVTFRYDENSPYILNDLSLKIRAGEYVAIVGKTGCGKSTLVRLLLGFEKPERGAVFYDRHDLSKVDPRSLRRQIGVVIQNGQLLQGDIFSNITISAPQLTLKDAWEAAELAGIAQDIREMPMGMQTMISEGGGGISGGQKQRLLIARAVAPKPKILIFDEATSALDNKTQKQVSDALDGLKCTRIVIAHRLSTIRNCDRILMMEDGGITEEGTYEELIRRKGSFAELVARQRLDDKE